MPTEIERKFLIKKDKWLQAKKPKGQAFRQGYISTDPNKTIRVRLTDTQAFLTIKGLSVGASRAEFEYKIPIHDAVELLNGFTSHELSKIRYKIKYDNHTWEIDVFLGENEGLIVAEIELQNENEAFALPDWIGEEVTGIEKYYNSYLSVHPFTTW